MPNEREPTALQREKDMAELLRDQIACYKKLNAESAERISEIQSAVEGRSQEIKKWEDRLASLDSERREGGR